MFWLGIGLAVGGLVVRKASRAARAYSPSGLASGARNSAAGALDSVRDFFADVREGMAEREAELHAAFAEGVSFDEFEEGSRADAAGDESRRGASR